MGRQPIHPNLLPDIPPLEQITRRCIDPSDPVVIRHVYQERCIELEDALRGLVGLIQLMQAGGRFEAGYDPTQSHRYKDAIEALR